VVVVAAGTNDLAWNDGVKTCREDILNNVMMMIELSRAWGSEVVVGSSFPSRHYWWNDGNANWNLTPDQVAQGALDLWTILKAYADEKGYAFADYYNVLRDDEYNLADPYCYVGGPIGAGLLDHVHPGAAGYAEMEKVLKPIIDALLNHPDQIVPGGSDMDDMDKVEW
jgi:lysophospholipase L1-like esterase